MPDISVRVRAAATTRVNDAFAALYHYPDEVEDAEGALIPNPQTKAEFVQAKLRDYVREVVQAHEATTAVESARQRAVDDFADPLI